MKAIVVGAGLAGLTAADLADAGAALGVGCDAHPLALDRVKP